MKREILKIFQIAAVFIGTIVGAGLASGKEITEFFTTFGVYSFIGIIFCGLFYVFMGRIICKISIKYNLVSYSDMIHKISPNFFGKITGITTTFYLISSASIILAGSGALIHQFFDIPKVIGTLIMITISAFFLLRETNGLIEINSIIVPTLIVTITTITLLYIFKAPESISITNLMSIVPKKENGIVVSTILYCGYNILCCSGVLVPLSASIKKSRTMTLGVSLGAILLAVLCGMLNLLLMVNQPEIYQFEIPLLFVANRFSTVIQALLLMVILLEMFSTEVSDVYSIGKSLEQTFKVPFKKGIFLVLLVAFPISLIGFGNLITTLYPIFGLLSLVFICQCIWFYFKNRKIM
ncbi:transporter [Clostridium sp. LY3-2]|uniref:YkvI family membrane protein n=1 Tax=Clostridium sp. LY3-2 TaxID=2942482 RepID=UPI00215390D3|nr:transporter [Clostridium sp. LY3-2]MCR6514958.1 transporter [Clostridium sp. LY3-2]